MPLLHAPYIYLVPFCFVDTVYVHPSPQYILTPEQYEQFLFKWLISHPVSQLQFPQIIKYMEACQRFCEPHQW